MQPSRGHSTAGAAPSPGGPRAAGAQIWRGGARPPYHGLNGRTSQGARRGGRRGHRQRAASLPGQRGLRSARGRRRRGGPGGVRALRARRRGARSRPARLDGVEVCRRLREDGDVPILILTARDGLDARVEGLDSGADDYLVKPFERDELLARMRALLRRRPPRGSAFVVVGDLRLNPDTREVFRGDRQLELTAREFELLEHLMRNARIVVSRQALLDEVWGYHPFAETNTVDVFISNLRRKLEAGGEAAHPPHHARSGLRAEGGAVRTRLPVKVKVAVVTAALTFVILCLFAAVIGAVAERRITAGFEDDLARHGRRPGERARRSCRSARTTARGRTATPSEAAAAGGALVRVVRVRRTCAVPAAGDPPGPADRRRHGRRRLPGGVRAASWLVPTVDRRAAFDAIPRRRRPADRLGPVREDRGQRADDDQPRPAVPRLRRARRHGAGLPRRSAWSPAVRCVRSRA